MTIVSTNENWFLPNYFPEYQNSPLTVMGMVRKGFGKKPFNDLTIERKRVKEFEESLM